MPVCRASLAACTISLLLIASCSITELPSDPSKARNPKLKIELISSSADSAAAVAAMAATNTPAYKAVSDYVELKIEIDATSSDEAARNAKNFRRDPSVLAVIGHARSGTTRAALPFYAEAAIPVLMPSATSPYALYAFGEAESRPEVNRLGNDQFQRYPNAFRLLPSDVPYQVGAIRAAAKKILGTSDPADLKDKDLEAMKETSKVMVICETTRRDGSDVYTKPMCDSLREVNDPGFSPLLAAYREIDLDSGDLWGLATEIFAVKPKLVILLAYPEFARDLLEELRERASGVGQNMKNYHFILSDASAAAAPDLTRFGSDIYVTSPINSSDAVGCGSPEALQLIAATGHDNATNDIKKRPTRGANDTNKKKKEPREEVFAFDAVLILAAAIGNCEQSQTLNRQCVTAYLERNHAALKGACQEYDIEGGERKNASYSVYAACDKQFMPFWVVGGGKVTCDAKWKCSSKICN